MTQHRQTRRPKTRTKTQRSEKTEPNRAEPTTACGGSHGRGGRGCPGCVGFSSWTFVFPSDFSVFATVLRLKDECIWLHLGLSTLPFQCSIISSSSSFSF